jgi:anthranilate phosphoribosyltransferase
METIELTYLNKLTEHYKLSDDESYELMNKFLSGEFNERLAAAILALIAFKGEETEEVTGFARALIESMKKFNTNLDEIIDIVGTGGDNKNTFNISTVSAILMSTLGINVAKEINTCVSSKCGSADLLKGLGINIEASYEQKKQCLEEEQFVFIHIPEYYPALQKIKEIEKELGFGTVLSLLPPICHPAKVKKMIIGASNRHRAILISHVLVRLEIEKAYILWNEEGYDELVPIGVTHVIVVEKSQTVREITLTANDFALAGNYKTGTLIPGGEITTNMNVIDEIDKGVAGIALDCVVMNTALALRLTGKTLTLKDGAELAKTSLKEGRLMKKILHISRITNSI